MVQRGWREFIALAVKGLNPRPESVSPTQLQFTNLRDVKGHDIWQSSISFAVPCAGIHKSSK